MTAALISQGELEDIKDRKLKWYQEEKAWVGKEKMEKSIENKPMIDGLIL